MSAIRSASENASSRSWVTKSTVTSIPRRMSASSARIEARSSGSMFDHGSSSSTTEGRGASARASATRCCWPPESSCGKRCACCFRPTRRSSSGTRARRSPRRAPKPTFCSTLRCGKSAYSWKTIPIPRACAGTNTPGPKTGRSSIAISPASGRSKPATSRSNVVLPQPLGPSRATNSPRSTQSSLSSTAATSPKRLVTPWVQMVPQGISCDCKGRLTRAVGWADALTTLGPMSRFASVYPLVNARALASRIFTYEVPDEVGKGAVVEVRFARSKARGVVVDVDGGPPEGIEVAAIERVVEELPPTLVDLALWLAEYYGSTPARTLALVAPRVRKRRGERPAPLSREGLTGEAEPEELTDEQRAAIERIVDAFDRGGNFLLAGATGSGKTEVYLQACAAALERGLG